MRPYDWQFLLGNLEPGVVWLADDNPRDSILIEPHLEGEVGCQVVGVVTAHLEWERNRSFFVVEIWGAVFAEVE